jgi:SPP1 gp7 family putative phage head morphogenesis protein
MAKTKKPTQSRKPAAAPANGKQSESIVINGITIAQLERGNQNVQSWISAVKAAESTLMPMRKPLYDTYTDVCIDPYLSSLMDKRIRAVKTTPFEWVGLENEAIIKNFKSPWFAELLRLIQERIFWGTTLAEVTLGIDGLIGDVEVIPRQNVKPESGIISKDGYSDDGFRYREGIYPNYILEIGRKRDLGMLSKLAILVLLKRQNMADFSRYNEMFGMPLRVYEYDPLKPGARVEAEKSAKDYGSAAYVVLPKGYASVDFKDSVKQSTAYAYDKLDSILKDEITISVLGQLLTTAGADGGSYALGNVHKAVEAAINLEDRLTAEYIINYPFKNNILIPHGYPILDFEGKFKTSDEISKEKKLDLWIKLFESGAPIAEEDFYPEFGIEAPGSRPVVISTKPVGPVIDPNADPNAAPPDPNAPPPAPKAKPSGGKAKPAKKPSELSAQLGDLYTRKCERDKAKLRVTLSYKSDLDQIIDRLIQQLQSGEIKAGDVDPQLYDLVSEQLWGAAQKGYGTKLVNAEGSEIGMLKALRSNVYVFSGFKNYQFLRQASGLLVDDKGVARTFSKFRDEILKLNNAYNVEYLRAEYNYAIASAQMAGKWQTFQDTKQTLPLLQYTTVGDARVRAAHAKLDGIIKPVDDPFWDTYMPPNAWNCRCTVRQLAEGEITQTNADDLPQLPDMFRMNSGKQAIIFPKSHPYFDVAPEDQKNADKNFGLSIPD